MFIKKNEDPKRRKEMEIAVANSEMLNAKIEYLAIMADVEMPEENSEQTGEDYEQEI